MNDLLVWLGYKSKRMQKTLRILIVLSLLLDIEILLTPAFVHLRIVDPHGWTSVLYLVEVLIEIIIMVGATLFWYLMFYDCMIASRRTIVSKTLWGFLFIFGAWWGSQLFYLVAFRRDRRIREVESRPSAFRAG